MNERITKQIEEMKKQTIGVEVEMNNIRRDKAAELAAAFFGTGRFENTASRNGYYTWSAWDASGREWKFQKDVSIVGPDDKKCELVTPILRYEGSEVPVAVWEVTESDEAALDRYEGYPVFYYKKEMELDIRGIRTGKIRRRKCFVYIMHEERKIGVPSLSYVSTCLQGYISFGFDEHYLSEAQIKAVEVAGHEE